jgi:predicted PurR-regulated permease PerM
MEKTTQEKIDYIYNYIKREEKILLMRRLSKFFIYFIIMWYLVYFYLYWFEKLKNSIIKSIKPNINSENIIEWLKKNSSEIIEKFKKSNMFND